MFPLPTSDHPSVASQKSLGGGAGHQWITGIEVAARVTEMARTIGERWGVAEYHGTLDSKADGPWLQ